MNKLALVGTVTKLEPLRYTPAGLPLLSFLLQHSSETTEATLKRKVQCQIPVVIVGELAKISLADGVNVQVQGFLAQRSQKSTQLVMHIQRIQIV